MIQLQEGTYFGEDIQLQHTDWLTLSITRYTEGTVIGDHHHENSYLSLLVNGGYQEESSGYSKGVRPGELLFRPKNYIHRNTFGARKGICFNIEFKEGWNEFFEENTSLPERLIHFRNTNFPSLFHLLYNFKVLSQKDNYLEFISEWLHEINPKKTVTCKPWVQKIKDILEYELTEFHTLASLSERIKAHPVYMSRTFKENTGMTIGEYQLEAKLKSSIKALFNTTAPISEISFNHGFYDDAHFIRSFKQRFGVSPYQFRLQVKS